jgi:hypothetical protein
LHPPHSIKVEGPKAFLRLSDICKSIQFKLNYKLLWNVKRPNQVHYEMTPFVIFDSKEVQINKHHQQAHETTKQHYYDIKKGNMSA